MVYLCAYMEANYIATMCLYALISVSESVLVKFSALYLVSKVLENSGIGHLYV